MPFLTGFKDIPCVDCESEKHKIEEDGRFKVISVDYRMPPGPNGLEVLRALRAESCGAEIIVYSNYRDARMIAEVKSLGATFLEKGRIRDLRKAVAAAGAASAREQL